MSPGQRYPTLPAAPCATATAAVHSAAMNQVPGLLVTDHTFKVPLDHSGKVPGEIQLFVREVASPTAQRRSQPFLLYLQGTKSSRFNHVCTHKAFPHTQHMAQQSNLHHWLPALCLLLADHDSLLHQLVWPHAHHNPNGPHILLLRLLLPLRWPWL